MEVGVIAAQAAGHVGVDFYDDLFGAVGDLHQVGGVGAEVEVAVLIHGSALHKEDALGVFGFPAVLGHFGVADGSIEAEAAVDHLALDTAHMPAVPGEVILGIGNIKHLGLPHQDAAAELNVMQFLQTLGHSVIAGLGGVGDPAPCDPVAVLNTFDSFFRCGQLALIQCFVIHK